MTTAERPLSQEETHALELLRRNLPDQAEPGIHLDLGCGSVRLAGLIGEVFQAGYVGVHLDDQMEAAADEGGHEVHHVDPTGGQVLDALRHVIGERHVRSVALLGGLTRLADGEPLLRAVSELLAEHRAVAVISVANVTHHDVAIKALLGQWSYTDGGMLDISQLQLFSSQSLREVLRQAGLQPIDTQDVEAGHSDQHFPEDHAGLSDRTSISQWLRGIRADTEPSGAVTHFVWALTAAPPLPGSRFATRARAKVFLSVLMRTQGKRPQELREALLCLAAQTNRDFEVLLVLHKGTAEQEQTVEEIIGDQMDWLRRRITLLTLDRGPRSTPLNHGLSHARGRYIAIFDDDDTVLGTWVDDYARLAASDGGRLLRCITLRQDVTVDRVRGLSGVRAESAAVAAYRPRFWLADHLVENESPPIGWAFPKSLHDDFGLSFDESMTTAEDWDFLMRAAQVVGVSNTVKVGAVYRWWTARDSSRTDHNYDEWTSNMAEITRRTDARPLLLPAGETAKLRKELRTFRELQVEVREQRQLIRKLRAELGGRDTLSARQAAKTLARRVVDKAARK